jgi:hypothetical protein
MPEHYTGGKVIRQELLAWPTSSDSRDFSSRSGPHSLTEGKLQAIGKQEVGRSRIIPERHVELAWAPFLPKPSSTLMTDAQEQLHRLLGAMDRLQAAVGPRQ